jgi:hypothetical protein
MSKYLVVSPTQCVSLCRTVAAARELPDGCQGFGGTVDLAAEDACHGEVASCSGFVAEGSFSRWGSRVQVECFGRSAFGFVGFGFAAPGQGVGGVVELARPAEGAQPT